MTTRVKLGAKRDGTLTAIEARVVSNTGVYRRACGETLTASLASPLTMLSLCQQEGRWLRGLHQVVPGGGFPARVSQTTFAIEGDGRSGAATGLDRYAIRRTNMIRQGDWTMGARSGPIRRTSISAARSGTQCRDRVEEAMASGRSDPKPEGEDSLEGTGIALAMLGSWARPRSIVPAAEMRLPRGRHLSPGRWFPTEMGNGSVTSHRRLAAGAMGVGPDRSRSSMRTPTARPLTLARSPAPARWSPGRQWR